MGISVKDRQDARYSSAQNAAETEAKNRLKVMTVVEKRARVRALLVSAGRDPDYIAGRPLKDAQALALDEAIERLEAELGVGS